MAVTDVGSNDLCEWLFYSHLEFSFDLNCPLDYGTPYSVFHPFNVRVHRVHRQHPLTVFTAVLSHCISVYSFSENFWCKPYLIAFGH